MKGRNGFLLTVAGGGMEVCWLYCWAAFTLNGVTHMRFPLLEALSIFAAGAWVTNLTSGRGWRVAGVIVLNLAGLACAGLFVIHATHFPHDPFIAMGWLRKMEGELHGFFPWAGFLVALFWSLLFWIAGVAMARRPGTYYGFCVRFDIGLAAFLSLFLLKLIILAKGGMVTSDPSGRFAIFPFFLFGLLAIGMSRPGGDGERNSLSGYRRAGIVMAFAFAVLLAAGSITVFAVSNLGKIVHSAHGVIRSAAGSSLPFVERVLVILFSRGNIRATEATSSPSRGRSLKVLEGAKDSWWMEWVNAILGYGLFSVVAILSAAMLAVAVVLLLRWLFSRTSGSRNQETKSPGFSLWMTAVRGWLTRMGKVLKGIVKRHERAADAYLALLRWARRNGCARRVGETPSEFGARLSRTFPPLRLQVGLIVESYNKEAYGGEEHRDDRLKALIAACRALRSPLYWPLRLRTWVFEGELRVRGKRPEP